MKSKISYFILRVALLLSFFLPPLLPLSHAYDPYYVPDPGPGHCVGENCALGSGGIGDDSSGDNAAGEAVPPAPTMAEDIAKAAGTSIEILDTVDGIKANNKKAKAEREQYAKENEALDKQAKLLNKKLRNDMEKKRRDEKLKKKDAKQKSLFKMRTRAHSIFKDRSLKAPRGNTITPPQKGGHITLATKPVAAEPLSFKPSDQLISGAPLTPAGLTPLKKGGGSIMDDLGTDATVNTDTRVVDLRDDPSQPLEHSDSSVVDLRDSSDRIVPGTTQLLTRGPEYDVTTPSVVDLRGDPGPGKTPAIPPDPELDFQAWVKTFTVRAQQLGWNEKEVKRVNEALRTLGNYHMASLEALEKVWNDVIDHGQDEDLVREASKAKGLGIPGAGKQDFMDCTLFALANAAGLPYGLVSARANDLLRDADWRSLDERENPEEVIRTEGLNGGEVIMLAEAFGQVKIVELADFDQTLNEGRPILVTVSLAQDEDEDGFPDSHQTVLTKTFEHGGERWYEMIDSNEKGSMQRRYFKHGELKTILQEDGISFQPDARRVPKFLRDSKTDNRRRF